MSGDIQQRYICYKYFIIILVIKYIYACMFYKNFFSIISQSTFVNKYIYITYKIVCISLIYSDVFEREASIKLSEKPIYIWRKKLFQEISSMLIIISYICHCQKMLSRNHHRPPLSWHSAIFCIRDSCYAWREITRYWWRDCFVIWWSAWSLGIYTWEAAIELMVS